MYPDHVVELAPEKIHPRVHMLVVLKPLCSDTVPLRCCIDAQRYYM